MWPPFFAVSSTRGQLLLLKNWATLPSGRVIRASAARTVFFFCSGTGLGVGLGTGLGRGFVLGSGLGSGFGLGAVSTQERTVPSGWRTTWSPLCCPYAGFPPVLVRVSIRDPPA